MRDGMKNALLISLIIIIVSHGSFAYAEEYEQLPVLRAKDVLPAGMLSGPHYRVNRNVASNGYLNLYSLSTDYGEYSVIGTYELKQRIQETAALTELQKFTDSKVFVDAAKEAGTDILTAPGRAVETVAEAVTDPKKTAQKVKKIPTGIKNLFEDISDGISSGARAVSDAVSSDGKGEKGGPSGTQKVADMATREAADYTGYSERESELYRKLKVDPYTDNKPLRDRVRRIANIQTVVNLGSRFVPGIPNIPGVGEASKYLSLADKLSLYANPRELKEKNTLALQGMGVSQSVIDRFLSDGDFSPVMQTLIVDSLREMPRASGKSEFLSGICDSKSRESGTFYTRAAGYLARYSSSQRSFVRLIAVRKMPAGITGDGEAVVALPADRVYWTKFIDTIVSGYRAEVKNSSAVDSVLVVLAGTLSPMSKTKLDAQGIKYMENVEM